MNNYMSDAMSRLCSLFTCFLILKFVRLESDFIFPDDDEDCRTPNGVAGICIEITGCQYIIDALEKAPRPLPEPTVELLAAYQCEFTGTRPKVCCPLYTTSTPIPTLRFATPERPPDVSDHRNINVINSRRCGPLFLDKISGGNKTSPFEYPWMALISYNTQTGLKFLCAGTIISDMYILTAAHCISDLGKRTLSSVRVGEHNIATETDCDMLNPDDCAEAAEDYAIAEIIPHPQYNSKSFINDIGLLRLSGPVDMNVDTVKSICLPTGPLKTESLVGKNGIVAGWGTTETGYTSSELLKVELPVVTHEACERIYNQSYTPVNIGPQHLCAGGIPGKDSCSGDSGGPLKQTGLIHKDVRFVQYGIVSFGPKWCGMVNKPGVFTKVAYYMDWILDNMKP